MRFISLRYLLAFALLSASAVAVHAQETIRPVTTAWSIGAGTAHFADTYLSPLKYSGWSTALSYDRMQVLPWAGGDAWISKLTVGGEIDRTLNPAGNATMWGAFFNASWGTMKRWQLPYGIKVGVGPALSAEVGCLYSSRNGNNPASAKAAVTIDAIGMVAWSSKLLKIPFTISYQPSLPVVGAFFSPRYDELYYEIYLGNHNNLAHAAWWGNRFKINNLVAIDLHLGKSSLRVGYDASWMSSHVNNLTTRMITHRLVLGVTCDWLSTRQVKNQYKINSSIY